MSIHRITETLAGQVQSGIHCKGVLSDQTTKAYGKSTKREKIMSII